MTSPPAPPAGTCCARSAPPRCSTRSPGGRALEPRPASLMEIATIGFTRWTAEDFFGTLRRSGIRRLIDVRRNNTSQLAAFAKRDDLAFFLRGDPRGLLLRRAAAGADGGAGRRLPQAPHRLAGVRGGLPAAPRRAPGPPRPRPGPVRGAGGPAVQRAHGRPAGWIRPRRSCRTCAHRNPLWRRPAAPRPRRFAPTRPRTARDSTTASQARDGSDASSFSSTGTGGRDCAIRR